KLLTTGKGSQDRRALRGLPAFCVVGFRFLGYTIEIARVKESEARRKAAAGLLLSTGYSVLSPQNCLLTPIGDRLMRLLFWLLCGGVLAVLIGCDVSADSSSKAPQRDGPALVGAGVFEVVGRTQCVPGKKGTIAPVPLHPVVEVFVRPGDRVKKDQKLV